MSGRAAPVHRLPLLPTTAGTFWLLAVLALLATAINYANNLMFALAFMLLAVWLQAAASSRRNLATLTWQVDLPRPVFAGDFLCLAGSLSDRRGYRRHGIALSAGSAGSLPVAVAADGDATLSLTLRTDRRGTLTIGDLTLVSCHPLGLWRARRALPEVAVLVYPAPGGALPLPAHTTRSAHRDAAADDFQGIRAYVPGDPLRRINWRVFGRSDEPMVNDFDGGHGGDALWLDWESCRGDTETRLAQLTRWVVEAERAGREYGLRLPGKVLPPVRGRLQREQCLAVLALCEADPRVGRR
jgi:uncharacterized protein (DUF58 family)